MAFDPKLIPYKNPTSITINNAIASTPTNILNLDIDNIGDGDAVITNPDSTTWILKSGASKSIVTGYLFEALRINATGTVIQYIYTV